MNRGTLGEEGDIGQRCTVVGSGELALQSDTYQAGVRK